MNTAVDISVVIPTRARGNSVLATLDSVFENAHLRFEVLLVDQSDDRDTEAAIQSFVGDPRFRYIRSNTRGAATARNVGVKEARASILAFTDDDCVVPADWLATIANTFTEHPDLAILFCDVAPAAHDSSAGAIPVYRCAQSRTIRRVSEYVGRMGMAAGMAARCGVLLDLGGFDESLGPGGPLRSGEDYDLALRALVKHETVYETGQVSVVHFGFRTLPEFKELTGRDWFAIGAVHAKYLRCSHWSTLPLLAHNLFIRGVCQPLGDLAQLRRPRGLKRSLYLCQGFLQGWQMSVDRQRVLYSARGVGDMEPSSPGLARPTVSIGLPVYNGERFVKEALDSLLAQTLTDFELVITDNASTDRTGVICREYAACDPRIRYFRNSTNIGGFQNHNRAFSVATGKYFGFAAYDDVRAPEMLERCVEALDRHPAAVLSYPITVLIDEEGRPYQEIRQQKANMSRPSDRFRNLTGWEHDCEPIYGLIRSEVLTEIHNRTGLLHAYTDADRTLLCQLSLYGEFIQIPEPLFYKRVHPGTSVNTFPGWRERMAWSFPSGTIPITLPHWQQFLHYLRVIATAPIGLRERGSCYQHMFHWLITEQRWGKLIKDFYFVALRIWLSSTHKLRHERVQLD